ncbi:MAG: AraC-type DNA-binding protein [Verrucomicrobia bacterium]|nr:MAG: AraC-type DNA-binding protein [Verrucomicrobiota bacterium]
MLQTILSMPETTHLGSDTREWAISDQACPALRAYQLRGVGMSTPGQGYRVVRHKPSFGHINVCLEGAGTVWANDRWERFPAGTAGLFPPKVPHGGTHSGFWRMCWVLGDDRPGRPSLVSGSLIRFVSLDPRPLEWALLALYLEVNGLNDPETVQCCVALIHKHVQRILKPVDRVTRLIPVWETVDTNLARPWTSAEIAKLASVSEVHLRRLVWKEHGCSPTQHLAKLRMRRAAYLLETRGYTVEAAGWEVGYQSTSAFSRAFKRWRGHSPGSSHQVPECTP